MAETLLKSVVKAFQLLDYFVFEDFQRKGIGLSELAKKMKHPPNSLFYMLKTMQACGYVAQIEGSKYVAGPKCDDINFVNKKIKKSEMIEKLKELLQAFCDEMKETVIFYILLNGKRTPIINIEYNHSIKVDLSSIDKNTIYEKPTGRILVAFADKQSFQAVINQWGYPGEEWNNITDNESFEKTLKIIRKEKHLIKISDNQEVISIAVPVLDANGKLIGSIGTYAPLFRCNQEKQTLMLNKLEEIAQSIIPYAQ